jgi:hypothetical protein
MNDDNKLFPSDPYNDPVKLVTTKPDAEVAEELKKELLEALKPALEIATRALSLGFQLQLNMGPNAFKQVIVQDMRLMKVF